MNAITYILGFINVLLLFIFIRSHTKIQSAVVNEVTKVLVKYELFDNNSLVILFISHRSPNFETIDRILRNLDQSIVIMYVAPSWLFNLKKSVWNKHTIIDVESGVNRMEGNDEQILLLNKKKISIINDAGG